jgi:hypothetical protein
VAGSRSQGRERFVIFEVDPFSSTKSRNCIFFLWRYSPNWGLGLPQWNSPFHFSFLYLRQSVGLFGRVISSSQGLYLYTNTEKYTHTHTHTNTKHICPGWDSNPRFRLPSERRQFMPRPLGYRDRPRKCILPPIHVLWLFDFSHGGREGVWHLILKIRMLPVILYFKVEGFNCFLNYKWITT